MLVIRYKARVFLQDAIDSKSHKSETASATEITFALV